MLVYSQRGLESYHSGAGARGWKTGSLCVLVSSFAPDQGGIEE